MKSINLAIFFSILLIVILGKSVRALKNENIVGGILAQYGKFTYHVTVRSPVRYCGGAIITHIHVITAAHCIFNDKGYFDSGPFDILAGVVDIMEHPPTRFITEVDKVYVPKQYSHLTLPLAADIAVLRVKSPFNFARNRFVSMLELPPLGIKNFTDKIAIITGTGVDLLQFQPFVDSRDKTHFDGYSSKKLHYAFAKVLSDEHCREYIDSVPSDQFCAQLVQSSSIPLLSPDGACRGDSGGSLVYKDKYLIGILSAGPSDCNEVIGSGLYTSVLPHRLFLTMAVNDEVHPEVMYCNEYK